MKFYKILIILIIFTKSVQVQNLNEVKNNAVFIEDIKNWIKSTNVIILYNVNSNNDMKENIFIFELLRLLFMKKIQATAIELTNFYSFISAYEMRTNRPLIIVYLSTIESFKKFEWSSKQMNMKWAIWVIVFVEKYEKSLSDYCINPTENNFNLAFDSKVIIKCYKDEILREWYSVYENKIEIRNLVSWNPEKHLFNNNIKRLYDRRFSIGGKILRTASLKEFNVTRVKNRIGLFNEVLNELGKITNFTTIVVSEENDSPGIINKLHSGEVDLAATVMSMTEKRLRYADFSLPLAESNQALYCRKPNGGEIQVFGYFQAFQLNVWGILLMLLLIIPICLTYIMLIMGECYNFPQLFVDNFLDVWRIYCQQGITEFPRRFSLRVVYFITFMSSLVLLSAYSASLISHLAVFLPKLPFSTLKEFVKQNDYMMIVMYDGETFDAIKNSNDWQSKRMWSFLKMEKDLPRTYLEGFQTVCKDKHTAFLVEQTAEGTISHFGPCPLTKIPTQNKISLAMPLPKNSPYTEVFNYHLHRFKEYGILSRIVRRNLKEKKYYQSTEPSSIAFGGVKPILEIVIVGLILAIFILILENIHFYYRKRKDKQRNQGIFLNSRRNVRIFLH